MAQQSRAQEQEQEQRRRRLTFRRAHRRGFARRPRALRSCARRQRGAPARRSLPPREPRQARHRPAAEPSQPKRPPLAGGAFKRIGGQIFIALRAAATQRAHDVVGSQFFTQRSAVWVGSFLLLAKVGVEELQSVVMAFVVPFPGATWPSSESREKKRKKFAFVSMPTSCFL